MKNKKNDNNIHVKELEEKDINKSFFDTLSNLASVGKIRNDRKLSSKIFKALEKNRDIKIFVAIKESEVIGLITTIIEQKFIHNGGRICHIEDVVTRKTFEKLGVGSFLVNKAIEFAKTKECYKIILNCSEKNLRFYQKNGFYKHDIGMRYNIPK